MALTISFYLERAEEAANEASAATLINVRERALRPEAAWRAMAERASDVQKNRAQKAEQAAAPPNAEELSWPLQPSAIKWT